MKPESFMVGLSLTVSAQSRSTLSNAIAEHRTSILLSQISIPLEYL